MKRWFVGAVLAGVLLAQAPASQARADEYDETQGHPLRVAAYLVHPVGFALEWILLRPLHWVVSQPGLEKVFGHRPHGENRVY